MTNQRLAYYYRERGLKPLGPWPSFGNWPTTYAERGFYLTPPSERLKPCPFDEDCEHGAAAPADHWFVDDQELAEHLREAHRAEAWRKIGTDIWQFQEAEV